MGVKFQRILHPTDFSELSLHALAYARSIAETYGAQLHCFHVVDEAYQYWSSVGPESIPIGPPPDDLVQLGQDRMKKFAVDHLAGITPATVTTVIMGRPFSEIVKYARENEIDLIVMGTHGRGALAHMLLGSTTEKVVRKAGCAVLTVPGDQQEFVMP